MKDAGGDTMDGSEELVGRTMVQVITEKYDLDNFPYCRGPGTGVVVLTSPQSSPVKGESPHHTQIVPRLSKQPVKFHLLTFRYLTNVQVGIICVSSLFTT